MPTPDSPVADDKPLVLRVHSQTGPVPEEVSLRAPTVEEAIRWSLRVRGRRCWEWNATERRRIEAEIDGVLERLGIPFARQPELGAADHLEIGIPYDPCMQTATPAALMPWEYLLTTVTADYRHGRPVAVTRQLIGLPERGDRPVYATRLAFVGSAPAWLAADIVSFDREYRLIENSLRTGTDDAEPSVVLYRNRLPEAGAGAAEMFHFSGFDTHEARGRAAEGPVVERWDSTEEAIDDGFVLAKDGGVAACPGRVLAGLIGPTGFPQLMAFGTYDSAAGLAPAMVAGGAMAAVGLQDYGDDALMEDFWARFYQALRTKQVTALSGAAVVEAYRQAVFEQMLEHGGGSPGVVLWMRHPVILGTVASKQQRLAQKLQTDRIQRLSSGVAALTLAMTTANWNSAVTVVAEPLRSVNYSLLHNQEPIFAEFRLQCKPDMVLSGLHVEVSLNAGREDCRCSFLVNTDKIWVDLAGEIKIPLTASLLRTLQEGLRSTITTRVSWGDRTLYQRVFPITLLAIDEWRDDVDGKQFLPSFILPRDPAVRRIIGEALPILRALQDDPHAAFRGYTGIAENPELAMQQAQAIWVALGYVRKLNYINPPPSYERAAQRIRFPRDVLADGRGTCLDLALLLAACLEYADLFPVVFLIRGHAFVGFWRDPRGRYGLLNPAERYVPKADDTIGEDMRPLRPGRRMYPWMWEANEHEYLLSAVVAGKLIALEATFLTGPRSFREAVSAGLGNLRSYRQFDCAVDIAAARTNGVTPIPLPEREG